MQLRGGRSIDLERFYEGDRAVLEQVYRAHFSRVSSSVCRYCRGPDAEMVIHEVFVSLIDRAETRRSFQGGDMGAWLATIAARKAIDHLRRCRRRPEILLDDPASIEGKLDPLQPEEGLMHADQLRVLRQALEAFAEQTLPQLSAALADVFDARFVRHLGQSDAARRLGIARGTLIEREKALLRQLGPFLRRRLDGGRS